MGPPGSLLLPNKAGTPPRGFLHPGKRLRAHLGEQHMQKELLERKLVTTRHQVTLVSISLATEPERIRAMAGTGHGTDQVLSSPNHHTAELPACPSLSHRHTPLNPAPSTSQSLNWGSAPLWEEPQYRSRASHTETAASC